MAVWSVVKKSELEGLTRLDAEFYQPKYLKYVKQFKNGLKIGDLVKKILHPKEITRIYSNEGFLFFLAQNIRNNYIDWHVQKRMPNCNKSSINRNKLLHGDVVVVRSGVNYGDTAYFENIREEVFASADVLVVRPNKIKGAYLATFLNTRQGKNLLKRIGYGAAQPHISPSAIKEIKIPIFSEDFVKNICILISRSKYLNNLSNELYKQAEQILLEELGLKDLDLKDDLFYTTTLKEVKDNNRMDAECYMPKYEKLTKYIQSNFQIKLFKNIFKIDRGEYISPEHYTKKAKRAYIRIKELTNNGAIIAQNIIKVDDNFKNIKLKTLKEDDFVLAAIGATLGKVNRISSKYENSFFSNNTVRFRLKKEFADYNTYFVEVLLRSLICQLEFGRRKAQTAQAKISNDEISKIILPLVSKEIQFKIAKYIEASYDKNTQAKDLLKQAINKVEEMIEKEVGVK